VRGAHEGEWCVWGSDAKGEGQRRTVQVEVLEDGGTEAASLGEEARGEERGLGAE
jgi:hypothetical protein